MLLQYVFPILNAQICCKHRILLPSIRQKSYGNSEISLKTPQVSSQGDHFPPWPKISLAVLRLRLESRREVHHCVSEQKLIHHSGNVLWVPIAQYNFLHVLRMLHLSEAFESSQLSSMDLDNMERMRHLKEA